VYGLRADVDGNVVGVARIVVMRTVAKWLESARFCFFFASAES